MRKANLQQIGFFNFQLVSMRSSEYQKTLDYLYSTLPIFQRIGAPAYKKDLTNTLALCAVLNNPHRKFKTVHVAGTNGKGSSSHMIAAILQKAGYKTGLYTSPHLKDFTERIKCNGEPVSHEFVVEFVQRLKPALEQIKPSFFEMTVAMAFDYFASQRVDVAVIEVGLGGRIDSTNVITPEVSLITNISFDHKDLLGDTLPKIASEKAGIIKRQVPVVISEAQDAVATVFISKANEMHAPITFASQVYSVQNHEERDGVYNVLYSNDIRFEKLYPQLKGDYQRKNIPGVLSVIDQLKEKGFKITDSDVRAGIENVVTLTGLKGRWQKLADRPLIIADTGHNEGGVEEVVRQIRKQKYKRLHIVWGMVRDKDISPVLKLMPEEADYYFCAAKIPRAMPAVELEKHAREHGLYGVIEADVNRALALAKQKASAEDFIFIGGSTFVVAEVEGL